jgi:hypothetical protein
MPPSLEADEVIDWSEVERSWGTAFPSDFREFIDTYGAGSIDDYLVIESPVDADEQGCPSMRLSTPTEDSYRPSSGPWPYPVRPQPGGLISWGGNIDGVAFYWSTEDPDPDRWPVVVRERHGDFLEFRCSMTVFLLGMLGPRATRPLDSPCLYGAPNSRFIPWREEERLRAGGGWPWEYLDALYEANEAEGEAIEAGLTPVPREEPDVIPPGPLPPAGRAVPLPEQVLGRRSFGELVNLRDLDVLTAVPTPRLRVLNAEKTGEGRLEVTLSLEAEPSPSGEPLTLSRHRGASIALHGPTLWRQSMSNVDLDVDGTHNLETRLTVPPDRPLLLTVTLSHMVPLQPGEWEAFVEDRTREGGIAVSARLSDPAVATYRRAMGVVVPSGGEDLVAGHWPG